MKKETWKYVAMLNMTILSFLGMGIHQYLENNYIDWYNSQRFLGTIILLFGVAGWLILVIQSSIYLHNKSRI